MRMTTRWAVLIILLLFLAISCRERGSDPELPRIGKEKLERVYITETYSEVQKQWEIDGFRDAVVVHAGAVNGLGFNRDRKFVNAPSGGDTQSAEKKRENAFFLEAAERGMIRELYWLVPFWFFDDIPLAEREIKDFLLKSGDAHVRTEVEAMEMAFGCLRGTIGGLTVNICSPHTLPIIERPVILSIDVSFFPLLARLHGINDLGALSFFFDSMSQKDMRVKRADIVLGIRDGRLLPRYRFLSEEAVAVMKNPAVLNLPSPPALWAARDKAVLLIAEGKTEEALSFIKERLKHHVGDKALRLMKAESLLALGRSNEAYGESHDLCREDRLYCYGMVYFAGLLKSSGSAEEAERFYSSARDMLAPEGIDMDLFSGRYETITPGINEVKTTHTVMEDGGK